MFGHCCSYHAATHLSAQWHCGRWISHHIFIGLRDTQHKKSLGSMPKTTRKMGNNEREPLNIAQNKVLIPNVKTTYLCERSLGTHGRVNNKQSGIPYHGFS